MKTKLAYITIVAGIVVAFGIYMLSRTATTLAVNSASAAVLTVGKPAPDFSVQAIDGKQFSLADHKGKPVIIFAMFGGCGECTPVGQTLNKIEQDYAAKGVSVVAIDICDRYLEWRTDQYTSTVWRLHKGRLSTREL